MATKDIEKGSAQPIYPTHRPPCTAFSAIHSCICVLGSAAYTSQPAHVLTPDEIIQLSKYNHCGLHIRLHNGPSSFSPQSIVSRLTNREMEMLIAAKPLFGPWSPFKPLPPDDKRSAANMAYCFAQTYCQLSESAHWRCRSNPSLTQFTTAHFTTRFCCHRPINMKHPYDRVFTKGQRSPDSGAGWCGITTMQGSRCVGAIIATDAEDVEDKSGSRSQDAGPKIYQSELASLSLYLGIQLPLSAAERVGPSFPLSSLVINITPTHVRIVEAIVHDPLDLSIDVILHSEMAYSSQEQDDYKETWLAALTWALFLN